MSPYCRINPTYEQTWGLWGALWRGFECQKQHRILCHSGMLCLPGRSLEFGNLRFLRPQGTEARQGNSSMPF